MIALFAEAPALPLHSAGPYVAAAYVVFLLVVLLYVWIMARKLTRNSRELRELRAQVEERYGRPDADATDHRSENETDNDSHSQLVVAEKATTTDGAGLV